MTSKSALKVSVIIPVFNGRETLMRAVNSVLEQSFKDYELLIIDDYSNDNPQELLKDINDNKLRIIRHEENKGAAASRNTGIMNAEGKYIAFLDADDLWYPDKLQKQYDFLENAPTQIKAICTSFDTVRSSGNKGKRFLSKDKNWKDELIGGCSVSPGSTLMVEREVFLDEDIGLYPSDMRRLEDWDWLLNYIYKYDLDVLEDYTAQIWVSGYPRYKTIRKEARALLVKQKSKVMKNFGAHQLGRFKAGLEIEKGGTAFRNRLYPQSVYHLVKAFVKSPSRTSKFLKRLAEKLMSRDYGGFRNKIKEE